MRRMNPVYPNYVPEMNPNMPCQFPQQPEMEEKWEGQYQQQPAMMGAQPPYIPQQQFMPQMPFMGGSGCGCGCGCQKRIICSECPPIVTCSNCVIEDYYIVKQPYIHIHNTEYVHHHMKCNEFIPQQTCCERHVIDCCPPCNPCDGVM